MIIPIKCFTCGKIIADIWEEYLKDINEYYQKNNINKKLHSDFLDIKQTYEGELLTNKYKLTRYCCRRMIISHKDINIAN
jgi:DNA-directed RNA polymerase subunit N (RpoN/RPB10)